MKTPENIWRKFERALMRRERVRLEMNGTIKPKQPEGRPTILTKNPEGKWRI